MPKKPTQPKRRPGRPSTLNQAVVVGFNIPAALSDRVDRFAKKRGLLKKRSGDPNRSAALRLLVERGLEAAEASGS